MEIEVLHMDITKIGSKADAIVNAANEDLLGGGGVDGAIHRAAGPELLEECRKLHGCLPGQAKATKAYNLDNKYIIHTVGPRYHSNPNPKQTLANCYMNCLEVADSLGLKSIAFCSIATGAFRYPPRKAAKVAEKALKTYRPKSVKKVYFCIYPSEELYKIYRKKFHRFSLIDFIAGIHR